MDEIVGAKACDACIDGLQADGETPCPCQADDLPRQVRDLRRELSSIKEERDRFQRLLYLEAEDHDRAREKTKAAEQSLVETRVELGEAMLVLEQQDRLLAASADLLASLDPETLNPEQFNAWCALSEAVGYGEQK